MRRLAASISNALPPRRRLACYALGDKVPDTAAAAFIAPSASIIGAVDVAEDASVWYNCTIRGDVASISIGPRTNIQDNTVIHVDSDALGGSGSRRRLSARTAPSGTWPSCTHARWVMEPSWA